MSDLGDRGRRRKKRGIKIKHFFQEPSPPPSIGRPIILTKPSADRQQTPPNANESVKLASKSTEVIPTIILKSREDSSSSSGGGSSTGTGNSLLPGSTQSNLATTSCSSNTSTSNTSSTSTSTTSSAPHPSPVYQIQQKSGVSTPVSSTSSEVSSGLDSRLIPPPEMKSTVKLVDENFQWCDNAMEYLQDQSDYFVIGVLGLQSVGKSTLMSHLAGAKAEESSKSFIFKPQSRELRELGEHCTSGIDIYMTSERIILLDVQPVLSASVMDHMMQYEKKYSPEYSSIESILEIQSLQIAAFLMAVCHTVLLVQDWMCDPTILRFMHTAEMLKPSTPATIHDPKLGIEDQTEYYPHLVFVHTRCHREDFTPSKVSSLQELYSTIFKKSKLKHKGYVGIGHSYLMPSLYVPNHNDTVNLFLIPDKFQTESEAGNSPVYQGHPGYAALMQTFCTQVLSLPRHALTHTGHSEKNWFHYAARTWELVKKSNLFMEYSRLLP